MSEHPLGNVKRCSHIQLAKQVTTHYHLVENLLLESNPWTHEFPLQMQHSTTQLEHFFPTQCFINPLKAAQLSYVSFIQFLHPAKKDGKGLFSEGKIEGCRNWTQDFSVESQLCWSQLLQSWRFICFFPHDTAFPFFQFFPSYRKSNSNSTTTTIN